MGTVWGDIPQKLLSKALQGQGFSCMLVVFSLASYATKVAILAASHWAR
jgi:hypothetical protein